MPFGPSFGGGALGGATLSAGAALAAFGGATLTAGAASDAIVGSALCAGGASRGGMLR